MKFIEVNNRIFDFSRYCDELITLRRILIIDLKQYFGNFGFKLIRKDLYSYSGAELMFYNKNTDTEIKVAIRKRTKEKFT